LSVAEYNATIISKL